MTELLWKGHYLLMNYLGEFNSTGFATFARNDGASGEPIGVQYLVMHLFVNCEWCTCLARNSLEPSKTEG